MCHSPGAHQGMSHARLTTMQRVKDVPVHGYYIQAMAPSCLLAKQQSEHGYVADHQGIIGSKFMRAAMACLTEQSRCKMQDSSMKLCRCMSSSTGGGWEILQPR